MFWKEAAQGARKVFVKKNVHRSHLPWQKNYLSKIAFCACSRVIVGKLSKKSLMLSSPPR